MGFGSKLKFFFIKNSPQLLTATGICCYGAAIVSAVKSSKKIDERVAGDAARLKELKEIVHNGGFDDIPVKETKREMLKTSLHIVGTTIKTYAPAIIFFAGGTTCILGAQNIMLKRQAALAAAYSTLSNSFAKYRERVAEKYGEDEERAIRQGAEIVKDPKTGEITYNQTNEPIYDWGFMFDDTCAAWNKEANISVNAAYAEYLLSQLQQKLEGENVLYVLDVYKTFGVKLHTLDDRKLQGSHVVGWGFVKGTHETFIDGNLRDHTLNTKTDNYYKAVRNGNKGIWIDLNPEGDITTGNGGRPTLVDFIKERK